MNARRLASAAATVVVGFALAALLVRAAGFDPFSTIAAGLAYVLGDGVHFFAMIAGAIPLLVTALGVSIAFRAGMFNIGAEGQLYLGAITAAVIGANVGPLFGPAHLVLCFVGASIAGGAFAAALGWLRARWGVDEVLSTLLSNYIAVLFCTFLANGPLRDQSRQSGSTAAVHDTAMFPTLVPETQLTTALIPVAIAVAVLAWTLQRSVTGYRWRMVGLSAPFADATGMDVAGQRIGAMAISGALCGCGGALLVTASQARFWTGIGTGIGWDAVLIALIAGSSTLGVVAWTLIYSVMRSAARGMEQAAGIATELSDVLIALIIIFVAARGGAFTALTERGRRLLAGLERAGQEREVAR